MECRVRTRPQTAGAATRARPGTAGRHRRCGAGRKWPCGGRVRARTGRPASTRGRGCRTAGRRTPGRGTRAARERQPRHTPGETGAGTPRSEGRTGATRRSAGTARAARRNAQRCGVAGAPGQYGSTPRGRSGGSLEGSVPAAPYARRTGRGVTRPARLNQPPPDRHRNQSPQPGMRRVPSEHERAEGGSRGGQVAAAGASTGSEKVL